MKQHPGIQVAVVMERTAAPNAWEDWKFRVAEVVPDEGAFGDVPRKLHDDGKTSPCAVMQQTLVPVPKNY